MVVRKSKPKKSVVVPAVVEGDTPEAARERVKQMMLRNRIFFWKPFPWQERALEVVRGKNTTACISSNKIGKTAFVVCVAGSWLMGHEPWTIGYKGDDAVVYEGRSYKPSSLGIKPPVKVVLCGEDWKTHIGQTIVPELKKWFPEIWYQAKKNEQGVEFLWEWYNGSTFQIMSYSQDDDLFESFRAQGAIMDEPPPESKYKAMSRGLLLDRGKTLLSLTPLKEAWILDEIVLSGRRDIGVVDGLNITDNPDLYNSDVAVLREMGLSEGQIGEYFDLLLYEDKAKGKPVSDRGEAAEKYLERFIYAQAG